MLVRNLTVKIIHGRRRPYSCHKRKFPFSLRDKNSAYSFLICLGVRVNTMWVSHLRNITHV